MSLPAFSGRSLRLAHSDFFSGLLAWRLWLGLGLRDIRIRYKRTYLGPWWITLSMAASFISLGMLFSAVLKNDVHVFLPYLAAGMVSWNLINAMAVEGPQIFVESHHVISSLRLPLVVHVLRCLVRNAIIFFHNCAAVLAALLILGGALTQAHLLLLFSLPLLFLALFSGGLILAIVGARFRDLGPVMAMGMQLLFFMTPIIWSPSDIPHGRRWWMEINPFYHMIEIVRAPLLGQVPGGFSAAVALGTTLAVSAAAYGLFCLFRRRISYWL